MGIRGSRSFVPVGDTNRDPVPPRWPGQPLDPGQKPPIVPGPKTAGTNGLEQMPVLQQCLRMTTRLDHSKRIIILVRSLVVPIESSNPSGIKGPVWFGNALVNSDTLTVYYGVKQSQFTKSRPLTARLNDGYCSITVANHRLIIIIRFVAKSYTHP